MANTLVDLGLESKAQTLKDMGKTYTEIASQLSETYNVKISRSAVFRYFKDNENTISKIAIQNERIVTRAIDEYFNTTDARIRVATILVNSIDKLADNPEDYGKEIAAMSKVANEMFDSIEDRISTIVPQSAIESTLGVTLTDAELLKAIELTESNGK